MFATLTAIHLLIMFFSIIWFEIILKISGLKVMSPQCMALSNQQPKPHNITQLMKSRF